MTTAAETQQKESLDMQHELSITRVFDAPRDLVWKALTDPNELTQWYGPRQFDTRDVKADVRPGGKWSLRIVSDGFDDGTGTIRKADLLQFGEYREVVEPRRLAFTFQWDPATGLGSHETIITINLEEQDGKTTMHFHQAPFKTIADRDGHNRGWNSAFDKLVDRLASDGPK